MPLSPRTFGIELECYFPRGKSLQDVAQALNAAGVPCNAESYNHRVGAAWKVTTDASLGYERGCEVVSPVLSGEAGIAQARTVCETLIAFGCKVDQSCGYHVHVGASDFTADQMARLAINFIWFEDFFDHVMPESRRRNTSRWVASNRDRFGGYGTEAVNKAFAKITAAAAEARTVEFPRYTGLTSRTYRDGSPVTADMFHVIRAACGESRYMKLNLVSGYLPTENRPGNKCVEFRQHSGTIDADKVTNWIRLLVAFVDKSINSKPRPRTVTRDLSPVEEMNRFFAYVPLDSAVVDFYRARRKALAGEVAETARVAAETLANGETIARQLIAALEARRNVILSYARPQVRTASRIANAINDLNYALAGRHDRGFTTRGEAIAASITRVRAQNLIPAPRATRGA